MKNRNSLEHTGVFFFVVVVVLVQNAKLFGQKKTGPFNYKSVKTSGAVGKSDAKVQFESQKDMSSMC